MCDILIFNSDPYFLLKISLPKIQPKVLNLFFIILSTIFIVPFLSFVFCFIISARDMAFKSIENASIVQIKDDFYIRFLLLHKCTFQCFHTEKHGVLHLVDVQLWENSLWSNFGVDINLHPFFHFSARRSFCSI